MNDLAYTIAKTALSLGAITFHPEEPVQWASGYFMPIYNDNRLLSHLPENRRMLAASFAITIRAQEIPYDIIAGTATAGISPATMLAEKLDAKFIYVRDRPKYHGLRNMIEGIPADKDLEGKTVVLIEDLISTGGSSVKAVEAIRAAQGRCNNVLSIFHYGLPGSRKMFIELDPMCHVRSLLIYEDLITVAGEEGYLKPDQVRVLEEWRADPFHWGERHGFPRVIRKSRGDQDG